LAERLESELNAKGYMIGERFPSVRDLSRRYRVSPITVHRAVKHLTKRGLLESQQGAGTFVRQIIAPARSLPKLLVVLPSDREIRRRFVFGGLQSGLLETLGGVSMQICTLPEADISSFLGRLCEQEAGGGALMGAVLVRVPREARLFFARRRLPVVVIGHADKQDALSYVDRDQRAIGRTVGEYLFGKGHRIVGLIMLDTWTDSDNQVNLGLYDAMKSAPLRPATVICQSVSEDPELLASLLERLLSGQHPPSAVVARSDRIAVAAVATARRLGLKVPEQLAVVSIGQNGPALTEVSPAVTAMTNDDEKRGRVAGQLLSEMSQGQMPAQPCVEIETKLVVRESS
jgi:DNA-binding LacI/PurR family transcriptional regulator